MIEGARRDDKIFKEFNYVPLNSSRDPYNNGVKICGFVDGVYFCVTMQHINQFFVTDGSYIREGQMIGMPLSTENRKCKKKGRMLEHVHVQVYRRKVLVNPDRYIKCQGSWQNSEL